MGDEDTYVPDLPDEEWPTAEKLGLSRRLASQHLGPALSGWRSLSWRGGDDFAHWVIDVISRRMNRFALLRACVVTAQASGYGSEVREKVSELLAPDVFTGSELPDAWFKHVQRAAEDEPL